MGTQPDDLADTWQRLMGVFLARRGELFDVLTELQLTPPHGHVIMQLTQHGPMRMRDMAESMVCDASYITALADRLEELGLAERRAAADDRRVKELALTEAGRRAGERLDAIFATPPPAMGTLTPAERRTLAAIARKLHDGEHAEHWMPPLKLR